MAELSRANVFRKHTLVWVKASGWQHYIDGFWRCVNALRGLRTSSLSSMVYYSPCKPCLTSSDWLQATGSSRPSIWLTLMLSSTFNTEGPFVTCEIVQHFFIVLPCLWGLAYIFLLCHAFLCVIMFVMTWFLPLLRTVQQLRRLSQANIQREPRCLENESTLKRSSWVYLQNKLHVVLRLLPVCLPFLMVSSHGLMVIFLRE